MEGQPPWTVLLDGDYEERWLRENDEGELQDMLDPYPDGLTEAYKISTEGTNPLNDSRATIEPLGHDQSDLDSFS